MKALYQVYLYYFFFTFLPLNSLNFSSHQHQFQPDKLPLHKFSLYLKSPVLFQTFIAFLISTIFNTPIIKTLLHLITSKIIMKKHELITHRITPVIPIMNTISFNIIMGYFRLQQFIM